MQRSTWNDTNQHWVPQFLLKGFGIKGDASHVYEMHKQTGVIEVRDVEDVASEPQLLTELDDNLMKRIEARTARVIGRIRKGNLELQEHERQEIDALVFAMMRNDPYSALNDDRTRDDIVSSVSNEVIDALKLEGGIANPQFLKDLVNKYFSHDYLSMAMGMEDNLARKILGYMGLRAHKAAGEESFVIGDSPVLVIRGSYANARSLVYPGSQIVLPIHSGCVLVYSWETHTNLIDSGRDLSDLEVRSLNRDYFHGSKSQHIFGRTCESLKNARKLQMKWNSEVHPPTVNDGWLKMLGEVAKVSRSRAEKSAEQKASLSSFAHGVVEQARSQSQKL